MKEGGMEEESKEGKKDQEWSGLIELSEFTLLWFKALNNQHISGMHQTDLRKQYTTDFDLLNNTPLLPSAS